MSKAFFDKEASKVFIKKYFINFKNFKENKLIFFYRILIKIIPDIENIPDNSVIDIYKFDREIKSLLPIDQTILSLRYGETDNICHSFSEISDIILISGASIYQMENGCKIFVGV